MIAVSQRPMGRTPGASETTDTSLNRLAHRRRLTRSRSWSASSTKLKSAMLKMNACIIQCAAIGRHLFDAGGRIAVIPSEAKMKSLLAAALVICFSAQSGKALAYACNNNYYVNSSGQLVHSPSCGQEHEKRTTE